MTFLSDLEAAATALLDSALPAVVRIGRGWGRGAGVVVADGTILTNAHNLRGAETTVTFADGRQVVAAVAGVDADGDLAVLTADTAGIAPLAWDLAAVEPKPGTPVFGLGTRPGGGARITFGIVSGVGQAFRGPRGRAITGSIEHTAPLARGSSGGPVVDAQGRFLGLNTNRLGEGFYQALPADADLKAQVDALTRGESPHRAHLGVGLAPARAARHLRRAVGLPDRDGLLVRVVEEGGPADRAGIKAGDLITDAGGSPVASADELYGVLDRLAPGDTLALHVVRGAEELDVQVSFDPAGDPGSNDGSARSAP